MARAALRHQVQDVGFLKLVAECVGVVEASQVLVREKIDLIFLDVQMPEISGLEFLKNTPDRPLIILVTSRPDFAAEAYEYNVVDYLLKPVRKDRLLKAVTRAYEMHASQEKTIIPEKEYFFIREKGVSTKLTIKDILYIQAMGDYLAIYTIENKHVVHHTMVALENHLPPSGFMRVHRSYIVALDKIDTVEDGTVYVNQTPIPVSDAQRSGLMKRLNLL